MSTFYQRRSGGSMSGLWLVMTLFDYVGHTADCLHTLTSQGYSGISGCEAWIIIIGFRLLDSDRCLPKCAYKFHSLILSGAPIISIPATLPCPCLPPSCLSGKCSNVRRQINMSKIMFSLPFFRALLATLITDTVSPWRGHHQSRAATS